MGPGGILLPRRARVQIHVYFSWMAAETIRVKYNAGANLKVDAGEGIEPTQARIMGPGPSPEVPRQKQGADRIIRLVGTRCRPHNAH